MGNGRVAGLVASSSEPGWLGIVKELIINRVHSSTECQPCTPITMMMMLLIRMQEVETEMYMYDNAN